MQFKICIIIYNSQAQASSLLQLEECEETIYYHIEDKLSKPLRSIITHAIEFCRFCYVSKLVSRSKSDVSKKDLSSI